jgi:dienelactone hydrolase
MRASLWRLLGDMPEPFTPQVTVLERGEREGCLCERVVFDNGAGAQVPGYVLLPSDLKAQAPAVLYHHMHGNKYALGKDELFQDWLIAGIMPGPALIRAGYVVLAVDAYCFGERQAQGPLGAHESGAATEQALFKHFVWKGATLWGMMVRDDLLALNYLLSRPEVDPLRVGATGMSMGGSRTTWLAALDDRVCALVPVAQMTRYADFAETGHYNLHGIYYYVPGMLKSGLDMEHLVALAAPRPQAILIGAEDPLSPRTGIQAVEAFARRIYDLLDGAPRLDVSIAAGLGHTYTPAMFIQMLSFFKQWL